MLQISQPENPICSATIDQMRLRRAMTLPLESQNVLSSGFQSEIQVGSFWLIEEISFLPGWSRSPEGMQARPGKPRFAASKFRIIGFRGRRRWRRHKLFKLHASLPHLTN